MRRSVLTLPSLGHRKVLLLAATISPSLRTHQLCIYHVQGSYITRKHNYMSQIPSL